MLFGDKMPLSENVRRALRYAPVAALMAIIIPELVPLSTQPAEIFNLKALAAVFAVILFLRTGNGLYVIIGGMVAFWTLKFIF